MDHLKGPRKDSGKSSTADLYDNRAQSTGYEYYG